MFLTKQQHLEIFKGQKYDMTITISITINLKKAINKKLVAKRMLTEVAGAFFATWAVNMSFINIRQKPNLPTWKGSPSARCSARAYYSANAFFRTPVPLSGNTVNKFQRPTVLQLNIEGLTARKMNVLHHFSVQYETLVILLQETH